MSLDHTLEIQRGKVPAWTDWLFGEAIVGRVVYHYLSSRLTVVSLHISCVPPSPISR
jgi:hypothetical protein